MRSPKAQRVDDRAPSHTSRFVSLKTLAAQWDCSRTTVARLLEDAGVEAYYFGKGRNGAKRYLRNDVDAFLCSLERLT
jgi:hypothetical protein